MSKRDPLVLIEDIVLGIQKIRRYTSQLDHDGFFTDELVIDAVARNLEIIGEAARQLPEEFKRVHKPIPWTQIAGLRNRIVHDYFGLDLEIIWEIIQPICPSSKGRLALSKADPADSAVQATLNSKCVVVDSHFTAKSLHS